MKPKKPLPASVKDVISAGLEPLEPQTAILAFLEANDGKRLDKRLLEKLNAAVPGHNIRMHQIASMTHIEWDDYGGRGGPWAGPKPANIPAGGSLLMAYRLKNLTVDVAFVKEHNIAYFGAAMARNEKRNAMLADDAACRELEATIRQFIEARDKLRAAFEYGAKFYEARYDIEREYDLNLDDKRR